MEYSSDRDSTSLRSTILNIGGSMTKHSFIIGNSNKLDNIPDKSVQLIITSPTYPMIEMWDEIFGSQEVTRFVV